LLKGENRMLYSINYYAMIGTYCASLIVFAMYILSGELQDFYISTFLLLAAIFSGVLVLANKEK